MRGAMEGELRALARANGEGHANGSASTAAVRELDGEDGEDNMHAGSANQWADRAKNAEQFGYDADAEAERWWAEVGEATVGKIGLEQEQ